MNWKGLEESRNSPCLPTIGASPSTSQGREKVKSSTSPYSAGKFRLVVAICRTLVALAALPTYSAASELAPRWAAAKTRMPEPLIGESITDLDRAQAGELELDLTGALRPSTATSTALWAGSLEAEWGATERLGLALELGLSNAGEGGGSRGSTEPSLRAAASWALLHDSALDLHLQAEATVRLLRESDAEVGRLVDPGNSLLPVSFGFRGGIRQSIWTIRGAIGGAAGGHSSHLVPLRGDLALFGEFRCGGPCGFAGLELDADWSWRDPFVLAPTLVLDGARFHLPFRFGVAVPLALSAERSGAAVFLRMIYEADVN
jgi:hypothetical protein